MLIRGVVYYKFVVKIEPIFLIAFILPYYAKNSQNVGWTLKNVAFGTVNCGKKYPHNPNISTKNAQKGSKTVLKLLEWWQSKMIAAKQKFCCPLFFLEMT